MTLMRMTRERLDQLRIELVGGDGRLVAEIKSLFAGLGGANVKIAEVDPAKLTEDHSNSDLSLVIFGSNEATSIGYLQAQGRHPHRPAMVAVLPAHSPAAMRRVLHAGADEVLILPLSASSLSRILARLGSEHHRMEHGSIYSLVSLSGGAGVTTLSGSLALALRYAFNQRVAIVDLNLQSGGLEAFLHVEPDRAILPLTATRAEPGASTVEAALTRHSSGVYLLAAPPRIEDSESESVDDVAVSAALADLRQSFDVVVVDCGRHVDANVVAA
jgi:pilus assembly protein CpaE